MNDNYAQRFGIGFILAMIFVLTMFQWTFPARDIKSNPILDELSDMEHVVLAQAPTVIEKEKKKQVKKVALAKANIKLVDDVKIDVEVELEKKEAVMVVDSTKFSAVGTGMQKPAVKKEIKVKKTLKKERDEPFITVEEMPRFGDCEVSGRGRLDDCSTENLLRFIANEIEYPTIAREAGITGRVIAEFVVEKSGQISHVKILRDIGGGCGQEAVRVLKMMPKWKPGRQQGEPVPVKYIMPIVFDIQ